MPKETIYTYTRSNHKNGIVHYCKTVEQLQELLKNQEGKSVSIAGGRNSFGDVFLPAQNEMIDFTGLPKSILIDKANNTVEVTAGVTSIALMAALALEQLHLPSQAGSPFNTVGGDISANVNGKDSWRYGNFYHRIVSLQLLLANGEIKTIRQSDSDLMSAIVGGLGLCGIILSATLKTEHMPTQLVRCASTVTANLRETVDILRLLEPNTTTFAYAWVQGIEPDKNFGRGVVEMADWADQTNKQIECIPPASYFEKIMGVNDDFFWWLLRNTFNIAQLINADKAMWRTFNALRYAVLKQKKTDERISAFWRYQYPMVSRFPNWYKAFLPSGIQELQCLYSFQNFEAAFCDLVLCCKRHGMYSKLCAIRRHKGDAAFLSFSGNGLSVTINYHRNRIGNMQLHAFEKDLVATVIKHGGKIYLAKFPYVTKDELKTMYPAFDTFSAVKNELDPNGIFASVSWQRWMV